MGLVNEFVERSQGLLDEVAASSFGAIMGGMQTTVGAMATLAIVLLAINVVLQYRPLPFGAVLIIVLKLVIITKIALDWGQFNIVFSAVRDGINQIAGLILSDFGGSSVPSGNLALSMDRFIVDMSDATNEATSSLGLFASAMMAILVFCALSLIAGLTALLLVFSMVMVTIYVAIAPVFIALSIFEMTKDYFNRWLQGAISYLLYPLVTAALLGALIRIVKAYIDSIDESAINTIADFVPFLACLIILIVCTMAVPVIVSSLSGMIQSVTPVGLARTAAGAAVAGAAGAMAGRAMMAAKMGSQKLGSGAQNYAQLAMGGSRDLANRIAARSSRY